ncbi:MarR family winged helix-turn-helix transcriptional regulator [Gryllotalpicola protaetiae]|uniref:MarR family transcriptional regulator n=1 Tax=Gryllotalpicola protaetiae TaxID=2419771 RepID=A0A387BNK0_9MICO|nr:MarR family transcriptional regulator [Gryllotalpicola protaetiae]AYG02610.1 MarR family transcriptional regulator [Gryllotalpicola protaetiae]
MPLTVVRRESEHLYGRSPKTEAGLRAVEALLALQRAEAIELEAARRKAHLTRSEFQALRYLLQAQRDQRPMGPKDLVIMLDLSPAAVTKVVDRLVELGDLTRTAHPRDRRAIYLTPTEAGEAKISAAYAHFHETLVNVVDALDEHTNNALHDGLLAVVTELDQTHPVELVTG